MVNRKPAKTIKEIWFTPCFDFISVLYGGNVDRVLGKMWRYSEMSDGVCRASLDTIASELGIGKTTVKRIIPILEQSKMIIDTTPNMRNVPHVYKINVQEIIRQNNQWINNGCILPDNADDVQQTGGPKESTEVVQNGQTVVQNGLAGGPKESTDTAGRWSKRVLEDTDTIKDTIKKEESFNLNKNLSEEQRKKEKLKLLRQLKRQIRESD